MYDEPDPKRAKRLDDATTQRKQPCLIVSGEHVGNEKLQVVCDLFNRLIDAGVDLEHVLVCAEREKRKAVVDARVDLEHVVVRAEREKRKAVVDARVDLQQVVVRAEREKRKALVESKREESETKLKGILIIESPCLLDMPWMIQVQILGLCDLTVCIPVCMLKRER